MTWTRRRMYVRYLCFVLFLGYGQSHFSNSLQNVIPPKSLTQLHKKAIFPVQRQFMLPLKANIAPCKYVSVWKLGWSKEHQELSSQYSWCSYWAGKPIFHGKGQNPAILRGKLIIFLLGTLSHPLLLQSSYSHFICTHILMIHYSYCQGRIFPWASIYPNI